MPSVRLVVAAAAAIALVPAVSAHAVPSLLDVSLRDGAVAGMPTELVVRAVDRDAPVTGARVVFTDGDEGVGSSACRLVGPRPKAFRPGAPGVFRIPHVFSRPGTSGLLVRIDSSGCGVARPGTLQAFSVETVVRGQPPQPLIPLTTQLAVVGGLASDTIDLLPGVVRARAAAAPCRGADVVPTADPSSLALARRALLCLINDQRVARGIPLMHTHKRLSRAARLHARSMVLDGYFAHVAPAGHPTLLERLLATRYVADDDLEALAENIGTGTGALATPVSMVEGWMDSPPHRANVLDRAFEEVGLGVYPGMAGAGPRGATYTLNFATR